MLKVLMGVGNELWGDDAIGIYIARNFKKDGWITIDCGTVPEDFTSEIKRISPQLLVIIDAAQMNLEPGEIRIVPKEKIPKVTFSTHGMPLSILMNYLKPFTGRIILIGIQPKNMKFGTYLSKEIRDAGDKLMEVLKKDDFEEIKLL